MNGIHASTQNVEKCMIIVLPSTLFLKYASSVYDTLEKNAHRNAMKSGSRFELNAGFATNAAPRKAISSAGICTLRIFSLRKIAAHSVIMKGDSFIIVDTSPWLACATA